MRTIRFVSVLAVLSVLAACGGGGGSTTTQPPSGAVVSITQQPSSVSVTAPAPAQFTVAATTTSGTLHFAWTAKAPGSNAAVTVGSDSATYTVDPTSLPMSGTLIAVNVSADTDPVTSAPAMLTVNAQDSGGSTAAFAQAFGADFSVIGPTGPFVGSYTITSPAPLTAGNVVDVVVWAQGINPAFGAFSIGTVATGAGDQFHQTSSQPPAPPPGDSQPAIYILEATITQPSSRIVVTPGLPSAGCNFSDACNSTLSIGAAEYSGATGTVDVHETEQGSQAGTNNSFSLDSVVTHATDLIIAAGQANTCHGGGIIAAGNGWTQRWVSPSMCFILEDQIGTSAGTVTPIFFVTPQSDLEGWTGAVVATQ